MQQETLTIPSATNTAVEEWRPLVGVPEVEGQFLISNFGRVKRIVFTNRNQREYPSMRIMRSGYQYVLLMKDGKQYEKRVHRLVAFAFIPNPNNYDQINHKDGNKQNNHVDNLEWCNASMNQHHSYDVLGNKAHVWTEEEKARNADRARIRYQEDKENGVGLYAYSQKRKIGYVSHQKTRKTHGDYFRKREREYYAKNAEHICERKRNDAANHRDREHERSRRYHAEHREEILARHKRYRQEHREHVNAKARERYWAKKQKGTDES